MTHLEVIALAYVAIQYARFLLDVIADRAQAKHDRAQAKHADRLATVSERVAEKFSCESDLPSQTDS